MVESGSTGALPDPVSQVIMLLAEDRKWTSIEVAETLWLALQIEPTGAIAPEELPVPLKSSEPPPTVTGNSDSEDPDPAPPTPSPPARANIVAPTAQVGVLPPQTLPVWLADPAMLTDSLAVIRALKPLLQKVAAGTGERLDEPATVDYIARTRLCLPILEPAQEPWFDIVLIVDRGSSMHIWQRLVQDVVRILRRYGAFRDVQVFDLIVQAGPSTNNPVQLISKPQRPGHHPKELIDQQGRRIAIVLSDCAGAYWWDGTLLPMLQDWGNIMPTVVWQMLPAWMWKRTALGRGTAVAISNDIPGVANQRLRTQLQERESPADAAQRIPIPVVTSEVRDLARWSLMLSGDRREVTPGFLLPQHGGSVPRSKGIEEIARDRAQLALNQESESDPDAAFDRALETIARDRVTRFLELSSPQAQRLIMLLAAAPVITLPVVRLIRDSMLYEAQSPLPVAEVLLSGLIRRLPGQEEEVLEGMFREEGDRPQTTLPQSDPADLEAEEPMPLDWPDLVQYDFAPRVRAVLLELLPAVDTIEIINSITTAVERRWNRVSDQDFRAFLTNPNLKVAEDLKGLRSFASVTADILESLGGDYTQLAQQLRRGAGEEPPLPEPGLEEDDFPDLEPFEFIDAQLVDEADLESEQPFPPPLQTETFTVITVQLQSDPELQTDPDLEPFDFTVVTLQSRTIRRKRSRSQSQSAIEWVIQRQQSCADRFIEWLPNNLSLEMVVIPGGTFLMGSPAGELGRFDREGPQHEVIVNPFCIGRYPVTQAQWRAVAAMPWINQGLPSNPSYFKGANRPVEQVSWYQAVEFCARLSRHTGRHYRLPTEAEWEYACRAGTMTPFYFGDMITTQVANYNGRSIYNEGPIGERRGETTSIDHFESANTFGLSDMHGNIWEWCQDHWHNSYKGAPVDGSAWLTKNQLVNRVLRGGSWNDTPRNCRSAGRINVPLDDSDSCIGFRVVCSTP